MITSSPSQTEKRIIIGRPALDPYIAGIAGEKNISVYSTLGTEGYVLDTSSTPDDIVIIANESQGVFYGIQSLLKHPVRPDCPDCPDCPVVCPDCLDPSYQALYEEGGSVKIEGLYIEDWPDKPIRGVNLGAGFDESYCWIRYMARLKTNFLVYGRSTPPQLRDLRSLYDYARSYYIEPVLSFSESGFWKNPNIAEGIWAKDEEFVFEFDDQGGVYLAQPVPDEEGYAVDQTGKITNPGFDEDTDGNGIPDGWFFWPSGHDDPVHWTLDTTVSYNGSNASVKMTVSEPIPPDKVSQSLNFSYIPVPAKDAGKTYLVSFWAKTEGVGGRRPQVTVVQWKKEGDIYKIPADLSQVSVVSNATILTGTSGWRQYFQTVKTSQETTHLQIYSRTGADGYGTMWLDDFELRRMDGALTNVLRTASTDIKVTNLDKTETYEEGTDYRVVDGGIATMPDATGAGYDMTISGALEKKGAQEVSGKYGKALYFDGVDDVIYRIDLMGSGPSPTTNKLTVEAYIKHGGEDGWHPIVVWDKWLTNGYILSILWGKIGFHVGGVGGVQLETSELYWDPEIWYHVAGVWDSDDGTLKIYRDGEEIASTRATVSYRVSTTTFWIGRDRSRYFHGTIDEVAIWDDALNKSQIQETMLSGGIWNVDKEAELMAYWPMDESINKLSFETKVNGATYHFYPLSTPTRIELIPNENGEFSDENGNKFSIDPNQLVLISYDFVLWIIGGIPGSDYWWNHFSSTLDSWTYDKYIYPYIDEMFNNPDPDLRLEPNYGLLSMSEVRGINRDSRNWNKEDGVQYENYQLLANKIEKIYNHIKGIAPNMKIIMWDDMVNPWHNGGEYYYQSWYGGKEGATEPKPEDQAPQDSRTTAHISHDIIMGVWWGADDKRGIMANSPDYFEERFFQWIAAPFYDLTNIQEWTEIIKGRDLCLGMIDMTFYNIYDGIEPTADYSWNNDPISAIWHFDEVSDQTIGDSSGNGNNGTLEYVTNSSCSDADGPDRTKGKLSTGISFDGCNDYALIPFSDTLDFRHVDGGPFADSFAFTIWFKVDMLPSVAGRDYILFQQLGGKTWLYINKNTDEIETGLGDTTFSSGVQVAEDTWYFVTLIVTLNVTLNDDNTRNLSNLLDIYVNDSLKGSFTTTIEGSDGDYLLGFNEGTNPSWFSGTIDEVKIYNNVLTAEDIANEYLKGSTIASWHMDEEIGNTIFDATSNNNDGTVYDGINNPGATRVVGKFGFGNAIYLDGVDDYGRIPFEDPNPYGDSLDILDGGPFALTIWFKVAVLPSVAGEHYILFQQMDGTIEGSGKHWLYINKNNDEIGTALGDTHLSSGVKVIADTWYVVTLNYDGSDLSLYVNTDFKGSPSTTTIVRSDGDYLLGVFKKASTPYWFNGTIDEVKIYDRALTPEEIVKE